MAHNTTEETRRAWTPGPWRYLPGMFNVEPSGDDERSGGIVSCNGDGYILAEIITEIPGGEEEGEANARLIAAAPNMFDALRLWMEAAESGLLPTLATDTGSKTINGILALTESALAKATGTEGK